MTVQLLQGWLTHEPGAVLDLGAGQAQLLIQRGIATADVSTDVSTKDVPRAPRTRAQRGPRNR